MKRSVEKSEAEVVEDRRRREERVERSVEKSEAEVVEDERRSKESVDEGSSRRKSESRGGRRTRVAGERGHPGGLATR